MKQTAVEWLVEQIDNPHTLYWLKEFIEQAKAMEKEQIETAWHNGNLLGRNGWVEEEYNTGSQYYKQTYGCNK